jgi:hypothetical protein
VLLPREALKARLASRSPPGPDATCRCAASRSWTSFPALTVTLKDVQVGGRPA